MGEPAREGGGRCRGGLIRWARSTRIAYALFGPCPAAPTTGGQLVDYRGRLLGPCRMQTCATPLTLTACLNGHVGHDSARVARAESGRRDGGTDLAKPRRLGVAAPNLLAEVKDVPVNASTSPPEGLLG